MHEFVRLHIFPAAYPLFNSQPYSFCLTQQDIYVHSYLSVTSSVSLWIFIAIAEVYEAADLFGAK